MLESVFVDTGYVLALVNENDQHQRHTDKTWGLVDCVSFVVMRRMRLSIALAFDQYFVRAGFAVPRL